MELTSAVRSVSCGNANSLGSKCLANGNSNGNGTINRSSNLQPSKDDGSGHEGDDEDEYGGGHGMTKTASTSLASSSAGSINKTFHGGHLLQHPQHPHQPVDGVYPRQFHMLNGYMPGGCNSWQPPSYRHPPPPPPQSSVCHCCGEVQMVQPQFYNPMTQFQPQRPPMFSANYVNGGFHFKNCPRAVNFNMPEKRLSYNEGDAVDHFRFAGPASMSHLLFGNPVHHPGGGSMPVPRAMSMQPQPHFVQNSYQRRPSQQSWTPVGILRNGGTERQNFAQSTSANTRDQVQLTTNCPIMFF